MNKFNFDTYDEVLNAELDDIDDLRVPISNDEDYFFQLECVVIDEFTKIENLYISGPYTRFKLVICSPDQITEKSLLIKQHLIERIQVLKEISNHIPTEAYHSIDREGMVIEIFRTINKVC